MEKIWSLKLDFCTSLKKKLFNIYFSFLLRTLILAVFILDLLLQIIIYLCINKLKVQQKPPPRRKGQPFPTRDTSLS